MTQTVPPKGESLKLGKTITALCEIIGKSDPHASFNGKTLDVAFFKMEVYKRSTRHNGFDIFLDSLCVHANGKFLTSGQRMGYNTSTVVVKCPEAPYPVQGRERYYRVAMEMSVVMWSTQFEGLMFGCRGQSTTFQADTPVTLGKIIGEYIFCMLRLYEVYSFIA